MLSRCFLFLFLIPDFEILFCFTGSGCSQAFDKKDFFIRSPNYPSNYSDNAECNYRIIRHSKRVCALKVTFASFHLEESVNCKSDYFDIEGKKFCGKLEDATTRE